MVQVFDAQGRLVRNLAGSGTSTLWVSNEGLPVGVYVLKVLAAGSWQVNKVMIARE
jgi:hypothetical protein